MKTIPHFFAGLLALAVLLLWASGGFHTGWTQTSIPVHGVDEITGIEYTTYEDGFVAGLDVLGGGLAMAFGLSAVAAGLQFYKSRGQN